MGWDNGLGRSRAPNGASSKRTSPKPIGASRSTPRIGGTRLPKIGDEWWPALLVAHGSPPPPWDHLRSVPENRLGIRLLQWATSACPLTKPLLQPLWQWKGAVKSSSRPNHLIRVFAKMLRLPFQEPYTQPTPFAPWSPWHGASDASASNQKEYYICGGLSSDPTPSKRSVFWFHLKLEETTFPWLFNTKTASAMIPVLELLGSLILISFILKMGERRQLVIKIPVITDNRGNVFCMLNNKTRQMPTSAILMQLVLTLHKGGAQLAPSHVKRDLNQWADELTHPNPTGFPPGVSPGCEKHPLSVYPHELGPQGDLPLLRPRDFSVLSSSSVASCTDREELDPTRP